MRHNQCSQFLRKQSVSQSPDSTNHQRRHPLFFFVCFVLFFLFFICCGYSLSLYSYSLLFGRLLLWFHFLRMDPEPCRPVCSRPVCRSWPVPPGTWRGGRPNMAVWRSSRRPGGFVSRFHFSGARGCLDPPRRCWLWPDRECRQCRRGRFSRCRASVRAFSYRTRRPAP